MKKDESCIDFVKDRPFNDKRYSVNAEKIKSLGWKQRHSFDESLDRTIKWYTDNKKWWIPKVKN